MSTAAAQDVVLTPQQRATLAKLGWPPAAPVIPRRDDLIFRRGDRPPVVGSLRSLHAFATIAMQGRELHVPRDQIGMILVNGRLIPRGTPVLPLDTDAVVLVNGPTVLTGRVEVDGDAVHVAGRTVQQAEVALIRLRDSAAAAGSVPVGDAGPGARGARAAPPAGAPGATGAPPATVAGVPPSAARPRGPDQIPWGQAVWRGTLWFEMVELGKVETGSYYVTWSEEVSLRSGSDIAALRLRPVSLVYQYSWSVPAFLPQLCKAFNVTKQGSGVDRVHPEFSSGGTLRLPIPRAGATFNKDAGEYLLDIFSPGTIPASDIPKTCQDGDYSPSVSGEARGSADEPPHGHELPEFHISGLGVDISSASSAAIDKPDCTGSAQRFRASPPYATIAGEIRCAGLKHSDFGRDSRSVRWQFDRGVPPADVTIQQDPCETVQGLASLTRDQRQRAVDRLKQVGDQFAQARQEEARLRATRNQLQGAFDLLLVAAAGSDMGKQLLELSVSDGMLETAAATGEITAAQRVFVTQLNEFIESYKSWTELTDDPGEWGKSQLLGESPGGELVDAALELFNTSQVLADAVGRGDGSAGLDYIEDNLGAFGPLVPDYAISKARQYVDVTRQWRDALKDLARLAAQGTNLAYQIAEADLGLKVRDRQLQECLGH